MEKTRKVIALVLLLGICIPLVLGAIGDMKIAGDLYMLDGNWIGLGSTKGRIVFQDETTDGLRVDDAYLGVSNPSGTTPAAPIHIARGSSPSNSILELLRLQRYGDDDAGQDEIGASIDFYLEDAASQIAKRGDIRVWMDDASSEQTHFAVYIDIDGDDSMECALGTQMAGTDVAFYDKDSGYHCAFDFTGSVSSDQILEIDMLNSNRSLSMADDLYVEAGAADSRINQDLTTDASGATFASVILTADGAPTSATATGTAGQIAFDSKYIYRCIAPNTWRRTALSTWTESVLLNEDGSKILQTSGAI